MQNTIERFWSHVKIVKRGCWVWTGGGKGYGDFQNGGRHFKAHRVAWEIAYGNIPPGMWILHACDNKLCVRPSHLMMGSQSANELDAALKQGRKLRRYE